MLGQRVVENFFKRAKFRRSKRLRGSIRSSSVVRREAKASASSEDNKPGRCGIEAVEVKESQNKLSNMSASALGGGEGGGGGGGGDMPQHAAAEDLRSKGTNDTDGIQSSSKEVISDRSSENKGVRNGEPRSTDAHCPASVTPASTPVFGQSGTTSDSKVIEALKAEVDRLKKELSASRDTVAKMHEREKQLRNRLSEQAQRQLQKGSSKFEDLNLGESRPTQLIKRYGNIYAESRLDAMDALDDVPNMADCEDLKVKLLLSVIVLAFRAAEKTLNETKNEIRELLHIPRVMESGNSSFCHAAKDLEDAVSLYLRKTVDKYDLSKNYKVVCERVWTTLFDYPLLKECHGLLRYIDDCVRIAWAMTVQNPPFVIDYESREYNPDTHSRFHASDAGSPVIKSVLWPMLLEGDGGPCVSKGVVLT